MTFDGDLDRAKTGSSVTLTLGDQLDTTRGDMMVHPDAPPAATGRNVSGEVGRWLARIGVLDPDLGGPAAT